LTLDTPAFEAGIEAGEIIFQVNDNWAFTEDYAKFFPEREIGAEVELVLVNAEPDSIRGLSLESYEESNILSRMNECILGLIEETDIFDRAKMLNVKQNFIEAYIKSRVFLVRGKDGEKPAWHYVLVDNDKVEFFIEVSKTGSIDVKDYGKILDSGWGKDPPKSVKDGILVTARKKANITEEEPISNASRRGSDESVTTRLMKMFVKVMKNKT